MLQLLQALPVLGFEDFGFLYDPSRLSQALVDNFFPGQFFGFQDLW